MFRKTGESVYNVTSDSWQRGL